MNFSLYIAKRYIKKSSSNNAINIISKIASFGIVIGSMSLFIVLCVFSGLKEFSLSFSNDFDPDLKISSKLGKSIVLTKSQDKALNNLKEITFLSKIVEEKVLFLYRNKEQVAVLKGIDNQFNLVNNVKNTIYQGQWLTNDTPQVVVGNGICQKLSLGLFDLNYPFEVFVPRPGKSAITNPESAFNKSSLIPTGIYAVSDELDSKYVFADCKLAQELLEFKPNQYSFIEIKCNNKTNEKNCVSKINKIFNNQVIVKNRAQLNDSLHKMLNTENAAIYLIFTLVIILTLFTLAGAIIMMIIDKKDNLKTLYSIGTPIKTLKNIFLFQGTILTIIGGILGISLGAVVILIQQYYKLIMITETLPYPVIFNFTNVFIVFTTIVILGVTASLIASNRVTKKLLEN